MTGRLRGTHHHATGLEHVTYETAIALILGGYVKKNRLGRVYAGDSGFRLNPGTVRAPDVAFVRQERLEGLKGRGFAKGPPDLAVEIFSPSDSVPQLMRKVKQTREIHVLEASGADRILRDADVMEASSNDSCWPENGRSETCPTRVWYPDKVVNPRTSLCPN